MTEVPVDVKEVKDKNDAENPVILRDVMYISKEASKMLQKRKF